MDMHVLYAFITALVLALIFGKIGIPMLKQLHARQSIREDGPKAHLAKAGTPMTALSLSEPLSCVLNGLDNYKAGLGDTVVIIGAGPIGLLFAFVWTLLARPFGAELAAKRLTRFSWRDIVSLTKPATLAEHRQMGAQMLDRLMQHLPRLAITSDGETPAGRLVFRKRGLPVAGWNIAQMPPAVRARLEALQEEARRIPWIDVQQVSLVFNVKA